MLRNKPSLLRYFRYLIFTLVVGTTIVTTTTYSNSKKNFDLKTQEKIKNNAIKLGNQVDDSLIYVENFVNLIATRISKQNTTAPEPIAAILESVSPKIDDDKYDIFTWTLFDFIAPNGHVLAASTVGVLKKNIIITPDRRSWIVDARFEPWKFHIAKSDIGIVSHEPIIPIGFGVTSKQNKFLGIISLGVNTEKLKKALELSTEGLITNFAILNRDYSIITASENFDFKKQNEFQKNLTNALNSSFIDTSGSFIKVDNRTFFCLKITHYPDLTIISGIDKKIADTEFWSEILPNILNTLYLTTFFLILLYFFRTKLLNPVVELSESSNQIAQGNTQIIVPQSNIAEINFLSRSIETVRCFVEKQQQEKNFAETANHNKTEFLASTAHELKNIVAGIIGLAELVKMNFSDKVNSVDKKFSDEELSENQNFLEDVVKLGEELAEFIHDITDVNQSQTGDFKIEEQSVVDVKDVTLRSIKLLKMRAAKSHKQIVTQFLKQPDEDFLIENLDPRRLKQIIVNLLSNSIKYANDHSKIKIILERFPSDASEMWRDSMLQNVRNNSEIDERRKLHLLTIIKKSRPKISIIVKDEGVGMSDEEIIIALAKYGRIANEAKIDSTGLGLPLVKHLVELQGGILTISSQKNVGTEVRIIF